MLCYFCRSSTAQYSSTSSVYYVLIKELRQDHEKVKCDKIRKQNEQIGLRQSLFSKIWIKVSLSSQF